MELISSIKRFQLLLVLFTACVQPLFAQRTLGLLHFSEEAFPGYTLFAPTFSRDAFLVDNCGYLVKKWTFPTTTLDLDILPDGRLFRTSRALGNFTGGGTGGTLEIFDWEGNLTWNIVLADQKMQHHHEAQFMPNGNILLCVWYKYSKEEAISKGFKSEKLTNEGIWSDRILEIKPVGNNSFDIVWQWDFWDHTVQDQNPNLPNFGVISEHPELLDVNFYEDPGANPAEWLHVNSLDYNERLDQILISSKFHNEIYIIDHSTTTEEAKGHSGGKYGRGGDFLYRWGNPRSYGRGTTDQHWLYGQHDVQWIHDSLPGGGNILLFNNGSNRPDELFSTLEEIVPPTNDKGEYLLGAGMRYKPDIPVWFYEGSPRTSFYSARVSGVQRLPNGNTLACEGNKGRFIEVNPEGKLVWMYKNPINQTGTLQQGALTINTDVFRIDKYPENYQAFRNRNLTAGEALEKGGTDYICTDITASYPDVQEGSIPVMPNPTMGTIQCTLAGQIYLYNSLGMEVMKMTVLQNEMIDISILPSAVYTIRYLPNGQHIPKQMTILKL